ncbi:MULTISPECIES: hypothetical protein [unclassified Streptomyces]|uniref:hypothetical protein n=1 Tax=unclassified Streptomyces TaxID=2593676 RepID=UPI00099FAEC9|nr:MULTISPECIES: hypothetical protein [unclassified Streptomyces]MCP3765398.1 hypothetical protein [Streptomyces sp. MAR25Y5]
MSVHDDHDDARDGTGDERGTEYDGTGYDGARYDSIEYDGAEAEHDGAEHGGVEREGAALDGDALMAAILGEPLPAAARRDPAFLAARDAAAADVAVLREQLGLIGDTLAREAEPGPAPVRALPAVAPGGPGDPAGRARPSRRARRPLKVALGALAAAAAASVVIGTGWLVTQAGQGDTASSGAGVTAEDAADAKQQEAGTAFGSAGYLACARLVVEGTVTAVEPVPGAGRDRVTLEETRRHKPEPDPGDLEGERDEVTFLAEADGGPRLRVGDEVLIGLPREGSVPDAVIVGEEDIAPERERITAALPASRALTCE